MFPSFASTLPPDACVCREYRTRMNLSINDLQAVYSQASREVWFDLWSWNIPDCFVYFEWHLMTRSPNNKTWYFFKLSLYSSMNSEAKHLKLVPACTREGKMLWRLLIFRPCRPGRIMWMDAIVRDFFCPAGHCYLAVASNAHKIEIGSNSCLFAIPQSLTHCCGVPR